AGPRLDRGVGDLADRLAVGLHPLAVEGRHHKASLVEMTGAIQEEQGVLAEERQERGVGLTGPEVVVVAGEDLLHRFGVAEEDDRRPVAHVTEDRQPDREAVAVARRALLHERDGPADPVVELDDGRRAGARRKVRHASDSRRRGDQPQAVGARLSNVRQIGPSSKRKGWIIGVVTPAAAKAARRARQCSGDPMIASRSTMSSGTAATFRVRSLARHAASISRASSGKPHQAMKRLYTEVAK